MDSLNDEYYKKICKTIEEHKKSYKDINALLNNLSPEENENLRCDYTVISLKEAMNKNSVEELHQYYLEQKNKTKDIKKKKTKCDSF